MKGRTQAFHRVLGVDPRSGGFGFGVLEKDDLIDWGFVWVETNSNQHCLERLGRLIRRFDPTIIALELQSPNTRRGKRVRAFLAAVEDLARENGCRIRFVSNAKLSRLFPSDGRLTRYGAAVAVALRFPEMHPRLPKPRKAWQSEPKVIAVFNAVARGLAAVATSRR